MIAKRWTAPLFLGVLFSPFVLSGCSQTTHGMSVSNLTDAITLSFLAHPFRSTAKDKECLERAMFFESNRSSRDGMIAVGTVVMNRLKSGEHGTTICEVVGEPGQFAPGVMTRRMNSKAMPDVEEAAEAVLKGERAPKLKNAMYFHTAGLKFPYKNMHYVLVAGGNAFYEKRGRHFRELPPDSMFAFGGGTPDAKTSTPPVMVASAESLPGVQDTGVAVDAQPRPAAATLVAAAQPASKPRHRMSDAAATDEAVAQPVVATAQMMQDQLDTAVQPAPRPVSKQRRKPVPSAVFETASAEQPEKPVITLANVPVPTARATLVAASKPTKQTRRSITEVAAEVAAEEPSAARFGRDTSDEPVMSLNGDVPFAITDGQ